MGRETKLTLRYSVWNATGSGCVFKPIRNADLLHK